MRQLRVCTQALRKNVHGYIPPCYYMTPLSLGRSARCTTYPPCSPPVCKTVWRLAIVSTGVNDNSPSSLTSTTLGIWNPDPPESVYGKDCADGLDVNNVRNRINFVAVYVIPINRSNRLGGNWYRVSDKENENEALAPHHLQHRQHNCNRALETVLHVFH